MTQHDLDQVQPYSYATGEYGLQDPVNAFPDAAGNVGVFSHVVGKRRLVNWQIAYNMDDAIPKIWFRVRVGDSAFSEWVSSTPPDFLAIADVDPEVIERGVNVAVSVSGVGLDDASALLANGADTGATVTSATENLAVFDWAVPVDAPSSGLVELAVQDGAGGTSNTFPAMYSSDTQIDGEDARQVEILHGPLAGMLVTIGGKTADEGVKDGWARNPNDPPPDHPREFTEKEFDDMLAKANKAARRLRGERDDDDDDRPRARNKGGRPRKAEKTERKSERTEKDDDDRDASALLTTEDMRADGGGGYKTRGSKGGD